MLHQGSIYTIVCYIWNNTGSGHNSSFSLAGKIQNVNILHSLAHVSESNIRKLHLFFHEMSVNTLPLTLIDNIFAQQCPCYYSVVHVKFRSPELKK